MDKVLPFGLRSAPKIYNSMADALMWVLRSRDGVDGNASEIDYTVPHTCIPYILCN